MKKFAIDTNILVYAHNLDSEFHEKAAAFLEDVLDDAEETAYSICLPAQVLIEFVRVITWQKLTTPLTMTEAAKIVNQYVNSGISVITQGETHIENFLELLASITTRRNIFDVALAATLKDNNVNGLYTVNVTDFTTFDFLEVHNPLLAR